MAPPIFRPMNVQQALEAAKAEGKLLLIDFTADWCPPCKSMDKTTWVAPQLVAWVNENAIAVQIDVDKQRPEASPFGIQAMPTMVLMRDGAEFDRTTGGRNAAKLLEWLTNAKEGRTELDTTRESLPADDPSAWFHFGRMLLRRGLYDEALTHLERCWLEGVKLRPEWVGVRYSYLVEELKQLAQASPPARLRIGQWRDDAERLLPGVDPFREWTALNDVLGDEQRVLEWFDRTKHALPADLKGHRALARMLLRHERWEDYGRLLEAPVAEFVELHANFQLHDPPADAPKEQVEQMRAMLANSLREHARSMHKALKAAGRADEALQLETKAVELDPTDEMRDALATA
jgi:thioredoxin 1